MNKKRVHLMAFTAILLLILTVSCIFIFQSSKKEKNSDSYANPLWEAPDPYVILREGIYYRTYPANGNQIVVAKSDSLVTRGEPTTVYEFPAGQWNSTAVWGRWRCFSGMMGIGTFTIVQCTTAILICTDTSGERAC